MVHRAAKMLPESTKLSDAPSIVKVLAPQQTLETEETVPVAAVESSPDHQRRARRPTRVALFLVAFATVAFALGMLVGTFADLASSSHAVADVTSAISRQITARSGAVAADSGTCSRMGVDRLKAGGNAIDAAGVHPRFFGLRCGLAYAPLCGLYTAICAKR